MITSGAPALPGILFKLEHRATILYTLIFLVTYLAMGRPSLVVTMKWRSSFAAGSAYWL